MSQDTAASNLTDTGAAIPYDVSGKGWHQNFGEIPYLYNVKIEAEMGLMADGLVKIEYFNEKKWILSLNKWLENTSFVL